MTLDEVFEHFEETGDTLYAIGDLVIHLNDVTGSIDSYEIDGKYVTEDELIQIESYHYIWNSDEWTRW